MNYIRLEHTDIHISRLAFGTASLHHRFCEHDRVVLLETAFHNGITHFDTSPCYGDGLAELALGRFIKGRRDDVTITTKVGLYPRYGTAKTTLGLLTRRIAGKVFISNTLHSSDWAIARAERSLMSSLRRLGTDYVDLLMLHEPVIEAINIEQYLVWLYNLRRVGRIRGWGIAGEPDRVWAAASVADDIAMVVQTRGTTFSSCNDSILPQRMPRVAQITYGYLSKASKTSCTRLSSLELIRAALKQNPSGAILFSSGSSTHIAAMANLII